MIAKGWSALLACTSFNSPFFLAKEQKKTLTRRKAVRKPRPALRTPAIQPQMALEDLSPAFSPSFPLRVVPPLQEDLPFLLPSFLPRSKSDFDISPASKKHQWNPFGWLTLHPVRPRTPPPTPCVTLGRPCRRPKVYINPPPSRPGTVLIIGRPFTPPAAAWWGICCEGVANLVAKVASTSLEVVASGSPV